MSPTPATQKTSGWGRPDMAFEKLFDNPLDGGRAPVVLRWSDDQLAAIAECLAPLLPDNLSDQMILAIACIARSIVAEHAISGRRVHYPRGKDRYRLPKRYRDGDPRLTWYYLTKGMDTLHAAGLSSTLSASGTATAKASNRSPGPPTDSSHWSSP